MFAYSSSQIIRHPNIPAIVFFTLQYINVKHTFCPTTPRLRGAPLRERWQNLFLVVRTPRSSLVIRGAKWWTRGESNSRLYNANVAWYHCTTGPGRDYAQFSISNFQFSRPLARIAFSGKKIQNATNYF